jgi:hypothetical protein
MGQERVMSLSSQPTADIETTGVEGAELEAIVTAIATSPIVAPPVEPQFALSDWERVRHSTDVDGFILAWIASHVRPRDPKTLS